MNDDDITQPSDSVAEAIAHATEFLFDACPGEATVVTRGLNGGGGAIFILKHPEDVEAFMRLYVETFQQTGAQRLRFPDLESN